MPHMFKLILPMSTLNSQQLLDVNRDYIFRLTSHINNTIPEMKRLLEEHSKRQSMFYETYASFLGYLEVLLPLLRETQDMVVIVRERYEKIQRVVSDNNPREVLRKVNKETAALYLGHWAARVLKLCNSIAYYTYCDMVKSFLRTYDFCTCCQVFFILNSSVMAWIQTPNSLYARLKHCRP